MSRTIAQDDLCLDCLIAWCIEEHDNGDIEASAAACGKGDMPDGMVDAIQNFLDSNEGMDWILTRPRNPKPAVERTEQCHSPAKQPIRQA